MAELKLPGAGDGASDAPLGAKDTPEFDIARPPFGPPGCSPSLSKLVLMTALPYGTAGWPLYIDF